jgi:ligand-binding SRPBCC domain-containing protein
VRVTSSRSPSGLAGAQLYNSRARELTGVFHRESGSDDYILARWLWVPHPISDVFRFFAAAENLGAITPPELGFRIRSDLQAEMQAGTLIDYTISLFRVRMRWRTEITHWDPPHSFTDTQLSGPYSKWVHTHQFFADLGGTTIRDRVRYRLPFGPVGKLASPLVARQLKRIFDYREARLTKIFSD